MVNIKFVEQLDDAVGNPECPIGSEESIPEIIADFLSLKASYKLSQTTEYQPARNNGTGCRVQEDVTAGSLSLNRNHLNPLLQDYPRGMFFVLDMKNLPHKIVGYSSLCLNDKWLQMFQHCPYEQIVCPSMNVSHKNGKTQS